VTTHTLSEGQRLALDQLREVVALSSGAIDMPVEPTAVDSDGWLRARISLDCAKTPQAPGGLRLRNRERFVVLVSTDFPFEVPVVLVPHRRWVGTPHVQWGVQLCLYMAPSIEWVPADGMFGLIERLTVWLEHAALGELDPDDQPLHPPVAYISGAAGVMVVHADLGELAPSASTSGRRQLAFAPGVERQPWGSTTYRLVVGITKAQTDRFDLFEWVDRHEWLRRFTAGELLVTRDGCPVAGTLAVLTDRELSFEYPKQAATLVAALESIGIPREDLFTAIGEVGAINYELARRRAGDGPVLPSELHVFVGTPSRRLHGDTLRQHLVCWRFDQLGRLVAENVIYAGAENAGLAKLGDLARELLPGWVARAETSWVRVMEARAEVTVRRDAYSSSEWVRGRTVLVLGCGALGGPIVEFCVRAGAAEVVAVDNDVVTPGILVRQPYTDDDIGIPKALALANRLNRILPNQPVRPVVGAAQAVLLGEVAPAPAADLVIDATADSAVASLLELRRMRSEGTWPPVLSVMIGHDARRGVATIAKSEATGVGRHLLRRLALASRGHYAERLEDFAADFFPTEPRTADFQPEPGCSSPTFTGSAADLSALAGHLFDAGLRALSGEGPSETAEPMVAAAVRLDASAAANRMLPAMTWLGWPNDQICKDGESGYEIRISQSALARIRAEIRRGARLRGANIETGGLLLGQVDDACRCIWVDDVSGPPPDSLLSAVHFDHGIEGVAELIAYYRERSGKLTTFVGMWHSHPYGEAEPSRTDKAAMAALVTPVADGPRRALIVIVGGGDTVWPAWVDGIQVPDLYARFISRGIHTQPVEPPPVPASHRTDAWPGGWRSRPQPASTKARKPLWRLRLRKPRWIP
jgi:integrative and conjugative element protein (TIGR02256 family)